MIPHPTECSENIWVRDDQIKSFEIVKNRAQVLEINRVTFFCFRWNRLGRVGKVDKWLLDAIITKWSELPTNILSKAFSKRKRAVILKFWEGLQIPMKFAGKIHFGVILSFGLSVVLHTIRLGEKNSSAQEIQDWEFFRPNIEKMNFSGTLRNETGRNPLEWAKFDISCSRKLYSKFGSPHPFVCFVFDRSCKACSELMKSNRNWLDNHPEYISASETQKYCKDLGKIFWSREPVVPLCPPYQFKWDR